MLGKLTGHAQILPQLCFQNHVALMLSKEKEWKSSLSKLKTRGCQFILGQSHFIKTVEDLHEAL